ncbi:MAG: hypothetical protein EHM85_16675 [Desulfobacteraceae bacterium]|nr:MAG: hypothetical protein EHM85_16675 [Desulfobacteraceae bacterium]
MYYNRIISALVLSVVIIISGCRTPHHTNTLIFGTNTKFAIDIEADPTGNPNLTIGYKRQEAVWMPLLANSDNNGTPMNNTALLFKGQQGTADQDTYSVLASFGATFSGGSTMGIETQGAKVSTEGGLAQFFATGLAARKLAEAGGSRLVSVQPDGGVSEEIKMKAAELMASWDNKTSRIIAYVQKDGKVDKDRLSALLKDTGLGDNDFFKQLPGKDINELRAALKDKYINNVDALSRNIK